MSPHDEPTTPLGDVLGVLPVWAGAALLGALAGESLVRGPGDGAAAGAGVPLVLTVLSGTIALAGWWYAGASREGRGSVGTDRAPWRPPADRRLSVGAGVVGCVLVALAAAGGVLARADAVTHGLLPEVAERGGTVELSTSVAAEPRPVEGGWLVLVDVHEVDGTATRERAALNWADDPPVLGTRWSLSATARPLPADGYGRWLGRQHASVLLDVVDRRRAGPAGALVAASEHVRARVRRAASRHADAASSGLLVGFVTGDTRLLPDADHDAMRASGLGHLTAVSGSNVALVAAGVVALCALFVAGAGVRRSALVVVLAWFAFVTRFEPSVLRAGAMAGLLLLADARGTVPEPRSALAGAVLLLVLVDPRLAASAGLLLSASATAGVLVVAPVVRRRLGWLPRRAAELAAVTIGAQIAVAPVLLATFGELRLATVPANLLAVPVAALTAVVAFVGAAVALVHLPSAGLVFAAAAPGARLVRSIAHGFDDLPGIVEPSRPVTVLALVALAGWLLSRPRAPRGRPVAILGILALVFAVLPPPGALTTGLAVTAVDVGQGAALLVESPSARLLVDAGGDARAADWLRRNGRHRIDLAVVSHPHLDHVGGLPEVLRSADVGALWMAPLPTELRESSEVRELASALAVPVRAPSAGDRVTIGDLVVEVLHPPPGRNYRHGPSELNDSSYVLRVRRGDGAVLLTGDVEEQAQRDLLRAAGPSLRADVLVVPHHGAAGTSSDFLRAVGADVAVISAGRDNRHGHPHAETLDRLRALGTTVRRTDLEGTVRVSVPVGSSSAHADGRPAGATASHRGVARLPGDGRAAADRRRRPAADAGARAAARAAGRRPAHARRPLRRRRAGPPARAADDVAVR